MRLPQRKSLEWRRCPSAGQEPQGCLTAVLKVGSVPFRLAIALFPKSDAYDTKACTICSTVRTYTAELAPALALCEYVLASYSSTLLCCTKWILG